MSPATVPPCSPKTSLVDNRYTNLRFHERWFALRPWILLLTVDKYDQGTDLESVRTPHWSIAFSLVEFIEKKKQWSLDTTYSVAVVMIIVNHGDIVCGGGGGGFCLWCFPLIRLSHLAQVVRWISCDVSAMWFVWVTITETNRDKNQSHNLVGFCASVEKPAPLSWS